MPLTNSIHTPVEELIHGVVVRDPYRWLEDRNLPETEEWLRDQHLRCEEYFADCIDLDGLRKRAREYLDIEVVDQPARVAGRYFYRRRDRGQEQASIYIRDMTSGLERLLVDPAAMGPFTSVGIHQVADDGSLLAYELKRDGGDRKAIRIVDVVSGYILPDSIETGYARGFCFTSDLRGFYYCHEVLESPEEHLICVHLFGEPAEDQVCFRAPRTRGSRLLLRADEIHLGALYVHELDGEFVVDFWVARRDETKIWNCVFANRTLPFGPILKQGRLFALSYEHASRGSSWSSISRELRSGRSLRSRQGQSVSSSCSATESLSTIWINWNIRSVAGISLGKIWAVYPFPRMEQFNCWLTMATMEIVSSTHLNRSRSRSSCLSMRLTPTSRTSGTGDAHQ
ncbi:hypothetical protein RBB75_05970 [Tunturibacter empetritectus]|uniref:Peptidase S9A N-terminal domain-containing protein n=1 Tax=Tunturiibacter empetritectus TaxID=3069691 RepID=A0AAU7ZGK1_9BACT